MGDFDLVDGESCDRDQLFELYKQSMRPYIAATWGWDDEFQAKGFDENLSADCWQIIKRNKEAIGGFVISEKKGALWLDMLIIKPEYRKKV